MSRLIELKNPSPEAIAEIADRVTYQLMRNEEARRHHWRRRRGRPPPARNRARTPWSV
jgi:hypothetical protein